MSEGKTFIEKTQPKNILEILSKDVLKRLLDSYRFPLKTALTVYYPERLPASMENLHWIELIEDPGLNAPFCEAYWHKPSDPKIWDKYCEDTCKEYDKQIVLKYYEGQWNSPRLFHCHCRLWDMSYPLFAGGRLVGVLYGGQVIVTEEVEDWCAGLSDVINEVVWRPDVEVDWDPFYEKETNVIPSKGNQVAVILAKTSSRTDIKQDKKTQLQAAVNIQQKDRPTFVEDLVKRYEKFKEFGKTLEGVLGDLYAAKAEAARHEHIHSSSRILIEAGECLIEEEEGFWKALDDVVRDTLPDVKSYVFYMLNQYNEGFEPRWTGIYERQLLIEKNEADFIKFCKLVFEESRERTREKGYIIYDAFGKVMPVKYRDLLIRVIADSGQFLAWADVIVIPLVEGRQRIAGGLVCLCTGDEKKKVQNSDGFLSFYAEALSDITSVLSMVLAMHAVMERREKELGRLTHELKGPLVAIRGATQFMKRTPGTSNFFAFDYPGDIWSWTELMGRLIDNADQWRHSSEVIQIKPTRTYLLTDVIAPTIKQVDILLRERRFSPMNIEYTKEEFQRFPPLWIDCSGFQQVMFNLLSNSIKYAFNDPNSFNIEIEGDGEQLKIWFRDEGPGIEDGTEEAIFEEGFRGKKAIQTNVTGQGLGLWVSRRIIERHGGKIWVSNLKWPTEFTISLPRSLLSRPGTNQRRLKG